MRFVETRGSWFRMLEVAGSRPTRFAVVRQRQVTTVRAAGVEFCSNGGVCESAGAGNFAGRLMKEGGGGFAPNRIEAGVPIGIVPGSRARKRFRR